MRKGEGEEWAAGSRDVRSSEMWWKSGRKSRQRRAVYRRGRPSSQINTAPFDSTFSGARLLGSKAQLPPLLTR